MHKFPAYQIILSSQLESVLHSILRTFFVSFPGRMDHSKINLWHSMLFLFKLGKTEVGVRASIYEAYILVAIRASTVKGIIWKVQCCLMPTNINSSVKMHLEPKTQGNYRYAISGAIGWGRHKIDAILCKTSYFQLINLATIIKIHWQDRKCWSLSSPSTQLPQCCKIAQHMLESPTKDYTDKDK